MDVSVIIVNYNTRKLTGECIDSIFEKTSGITFEVIVVDNASQDDSIEIFRKDPRKSGIREGQQFRYQVCDGPKHTVPQFRHTLNQQCLENFIRLLGQQFRCRGVRRKFVRRRP